MGAQPLLNSSAYVLRDVSVPVDTRPADQAVVARFWARVDASAGPTACWPWTGSSMEANGYGQVRLPSPHTGKPTMRTTHRVAYEFAKGPIPKGKLVLHSMGCTTRKCCNPRHLRTGTHAENHADAVILKTLGKRKLDADAVRKIVHLKRTVGLSNKVLAERFGVGPDTISKILAGKLWSHATGIRRDEYVPRTGRPARLRIAVDNTVHSGSAP